MCTTDVHEVRGGDARSTAAVAGGRGAAVLTGTARGRPDASACLDDVADAVVGFVAGLVGRAAAADDWAGAAGDWAGRGFAAGCATEADRVDAVATHPASTAAAITHRPP